MQDTSDRVQFVHPVSKAPLYPNERADLCEDVHLGRVLFQNLNGSYDFVCDKDRERERLHYDRVYKSGPDGTPTLSLNELKRMWAAAPELPPLLASLGDLKGRLVLILGNGCSLKEFFFLIRGAYCVSTDLSFTAVNRLRDCFESSELAAMFRGQIEYHAVDALNLPFSDRSVDIIYGYAFVHHLDDLDRFFSEVDRCLRPGGSCRFLDDGFSPIWQFAKKQC